MNEESSKTIDLLKNTIKKLTENLQVEKIRNKELDIRNKELENMLDSYRNTSSISPIRTSDKEKKVVELYAQGVPAGFIYKIFLEQLYIDMSLNDIEKIISNIDSNSPKISGELMNYYIECKKSFVEKSSLDKGYFATSLHNKFKLLEGEYSLSLMIAKDSGDEESKRKLLDQMTKLYQIEASVFSKNTLSIFGSKNAENITEDYDKEANDIFGDNVESNNIIRFKAK